MLNLIKYEFRKTLMAKLILLGLTVCLEGYFLYGVLSGKESPSTTASILLFILAVLGIVFVGIHSIVTLHHDMNSKQSYMLFMTPHSNYAILGAKAIECSISVLLVSAFFGGLGMLDWELLNNKFGFLGSLSDFFDSLLRTMNLTYLTDPSTIAAFVTQSIAAWIYTIMIAFLSVTAAASILRGKKLSGLVAFVFFIAFSLICNKLVSLIPSSGDLVTDLLIDAAINLVIAVDFYITTATLMEKKLSV